VKIEKKSSKAGLPYTSVCRNERGSNNWVALGEKKKSAGDHVPVVRARR